MNRMIVGGVVAGGLMVGAAALVIGAGVAHAAPAGNSGGVVAFNRDMDAAGFYNDGGPQAQLAAGQGVCYKIAGGERPLAVAIDLMDISGMSPEGSGKFVAISVRDLCPQFIPQVMADARGGSSSSAAYNAPAQGQPVQVVSYIDRRGHKH